jgi:hypothetical protein
MNRAGITTYPIPFFGDLLDAEVLTVGLNPSADEFKAGRWPVGLDADALVSRLRAYFDQATQAHRWFDQWRMALAHIGASYERTPARRAAHVDLSPRATASARSVTANQLFQQMLIDDLPWALDVIRMAPRARLLLLAGTGVRGTGYLDDFLRKHLSRTPTLRGTLKRVTKSVGGHGRIARYELELGDRRLPLWYCSRSPSARRGERTAAGEPAPTLAQRVGEDREWLLQELV